MIGLHKRITKLFSVAFITFLLGLTVKGQVVVQRCDLATGWSGSQAITIDNADKMEGSGAIATMAQAGISDWFKKSFSRTHTGIDNSGYLSFWLYVSDASKLDGGEIEISSSGGPDNMEYNWPLSSADVVDGWNHMQLQISSAGESGGSAKLDSINFFRIYQNLSAPVTVKIDFIRFTPNLNTPTWPLLDVAQVDNSSLDGKVMFGYQGWFNHPDDGAGRGWIHWGDLYEPIKLSCDLFPDMREFGADEKYNSHFTFNDGSMAPVFSSYNGNTVVRHMKWIRDYNLDGVFIQRFISGYYNQADMNHKDTVAKNVMQGSEKYGGVFAMMYDGIAGMVEEIKNDWMHLVDDIGVTSSDRYLHHNGLPLVSLWGYSVREDATVDQLIELIDFFTNNPEPKYRAAIKLGVAWNWYEQSEFQAAFKDVDVISPWFSGSTDYDRGQDWCDQNNVDYLPVVHPGFSWHNLSLDYESHPGSDDLNRTPRDKGNYLWNEVNEVLSANAKSVYIAMYDEIDEGTAMFKLAETIDDVPRERDWVTLDIDGYDLPSDWYLRLASLASNVVRGYEDNKSSLDALPAPPEGIMTIRITDETNGADNGAMEFIFPDFPGETTIEISIDSGATWAYTTPDNVGTFTISDLPDGNYPVFVRHSSASAAVDMGHVRITDVYEGLPSQANTPFPADGATEVRINTSMGWTAGDHSVSHYIYLGTDANPDSITYQSSSSFSPEALEYSTTYYWRIDEVNSSGRTEGDLWSFTTSGPGGPKDHVVLDYCDEVTGWTSHNSVSIDSDEKQEGFSSLISNGNGTVWFNKLFDPAVNTFSDTGSYFDLWIYVSDVSLFSGGGQIEIGSAGQPDQDEYSWSIDGLALVNGWNELHLPIKDASVIGTPDLSAINWFRLYQFVSAPVETRIDFLRFTELATIPLAVPSNIVATPGNETVSLDWDDNTEGTLAGYNIYRTITSGANHVRINAELLESSEYTDNDVSNGTTYYYSLIAVDTLGYESAMSDEVEAMPRNTAKPDAPLNLTATPGDTQVTLDWDDNTESDLSGYKVYRTTTSGVDYWNVSTVTESTYTDKYLTNDKTYYYIVRAINDSQNESDASNEVEVTPGVTSLIDQAEAKYLFNMYPNPASSITTMEILLKENADVSVAIFDFTGRELHQFITMQNWVAGDHTLHLPLSGFKKGSYVVNIQINNERIAKVLIIE